MATTLTVQLENRSNSVVFAYITGQALQKNNHVCFLQADGKTIYYPESPSKTLSPLSKDCAIKLGTQGIITTVVIPPIAGGRIWFSLNEQLTFLLNPGPAIVEPSVTNPSDPNIHVTWDFCEFTFANSQLYANISYVDFVCLPISLALTPESGPVQEVLGLKSDGLATICAGLNAQSLTDGSDWDKLVVQQGGNNLRALSPNNGIVMNLGNSFRGYYDKYVDQVWSTYTQSPLTIDTQAQWGQVNGGVSNGQLSFPGIGDFSKPSTSDIFSCSTGPFANNAGAFGPLTARISAALNRSTLLTTEVHPTNVKVSDYYQHDTTNHYARLVHQANIDGRGYAFPYDDVSAPNSVDQSGFVNASAKLFKVSVG